MDTLVLMKNGLSLTFTERVYVGVRTQHTSLVTDTCTYHGIGRESYLLTSFDHLSKQTCHTCEVFHIVFQSSLLSYTYKKTIKTSVYFWNRVLDIHHDTCVFF